MTAPIAAPLSSDTCESCSAAQVLARRLIVYRELFSLASDRLDEQARVIDRQRADLQEQRELWARCAERLIDVEL